MLMKFQKEIHLWTISKGKPDPVSEITTATVLMIKKQKLMQLCHNSLTTVHHHAWVAMVLTNMASSGVEKLLGGS